MADKKMWNRADVRAEMNRMVKEARDACKKLHDVAGRIAALGVETNFTDDATVAIVALKKRAEIAPVMVIDSIGKLSPSVATTAKKVTDAWKKFNPPGPNVRVIPRGPSGDFGLLEPETWGSRGCLCGAADKPVTTPNVIHGSATQCPFRPLGETWAELGCTCDLKSVHVTRYETVFHGRECATPGRYEAGVKQ